MSVGIAFAFEDRTGLSPKKATISFEGGLAQ